MNCERIDLDELTVERNQVKEVLKILLHSIIFQRALGESREREIDSALFELSYVCCDSRLVHLKVEEHAEAFWSALDTTPTVRVQSSIAFVERRVRPTAFSFFRTEERVIWERWNIPLTVYTLDGDEGGDSGRRAPPPSWRGKMGEQTARSRLHL
eukprot:3669370-Pleurochrysis_carterae.AAC.2